jgi:ADP-ribosylglycohydrolase
MVSDDTEHTVFVAQALITSNLNPERFERHLAKSLRWWLAGLPAGTGLATLRACLKLWVGFSPERSGVFSAGNGPAMRSAILGLVFGEDVTVLSDWVMRTTRITHTDPKAYMGALTVALAAHLSALRQHVAPQRFVETVKTALAQHDSQEFVELIHKAAIAAQKKQSATDFAHSIGSHKGVSGYVLHTVPCVIQTWLKNPTDFAQGLQEIIEAGGDTDTTGAILGAIIGARVGENGIPQKWRTSIVEWPRTIGWIKDLGYCLAMRLQSKADVKAPGYCVPGILPRNLIFFLIVMFHGLRRLAPPY